MKRCSIAIFLSFFLVQGLCFSAFAQLIKSQGAPKLTNFEREIYGGAHQVWDIAQDKSGNIFFASLSHLVEYDGVKWRSYPVSNRSNMRCLGFHNGKLYSGGIGTFGYWERNPDGEMLYRPLVDMIDSETEDIDEFWRIHSLGGKLYAQSFDRIFVLDGKVRQQIQAPAKFHFSFLVNNRLYIQDKKYGLYTLEQDRLELIVPQGKLGNDEIWGMIDLQEKILLATYSGRLLLLEKDELTEWKTEADDFLKANSVFTLKKINENFIAIGTILGGIIVIDKHGHVVMHVDKNKGLRNNTVLSFLQDAQQNLWLGLDNGITFLNTNSPYSHFADTKGTIGAVYTSIVHNGQFYIGTNQGLLSADQESLFNPLDGSSFKLQEGTQGQVWTMIEHKGALICGHDKGIFQIGKKVRKISNKKGVWNFKVWPSNSSIIIAGTYRGLVVISVDKNGNVKEYAQPRGFIESSRFLAIDEYENIWVSHPVKGLYRLRLSKDFTEITEKEYYGQNSSIGTKIDNYVMKFEGKVVFSAPTGFFSYDVIKNDFQPHNTLNQLLGKGLVINQMMKQGQNTWYTNDTKVGFLSREGNNYVHHQDMFSNSDNNTIPNFSNIFSLNDSTFCLTSYEGLTLLHYHKDKGKGELFSPQIRRIKALGKNDTLLLDLRKELHEIPYENNVLQLEFSAPNYGYNEYEIFYDLGDGKLRPSKSQPVLLSNLNSGDYSIRLVLKYGTKQVASKNINVRILQPWFLNVWSLAMWITLFLGTVWLMRLFYKMRLTREQIELQQQKEQELKAQQEHYENEALKDQQKIMLLEKDQLESEVRFKSKELANMVLNNVDKNEVLSKIKAELERIQEESSQKLPKKYYKKLIDLIDQHMSTEDDWKIFELNFNKAYEGFFKKLKAKHPNLTPNDMRLCAYLRMNLASKDIAPLLSISVRSVEVSRYRLRKKLEIPHDKNLIEYMLEIS